MSQNQNRFRALSIEIVTLIVLIPLAIFLTSKIWHKQEKPNQQVENVPTTVSSALPAVTISPDPTVEAATTTKTKEPVTTPIPAHQQITLIFQGPKETASYKISVSKKITVIDAMRMAQTQGLILKTKDYGAPLGILIEGINNISNDSKNQKYWTLYVNDIRAAVGASTATVTPGDTITWKFENTTL